MRISKLFTCSVCLSTFLGGSVVAATSSAAADVRYVALGDSYSSGLGTGNYDPASGACKRSPNAYPAMWASSHSTASFTFAACSGATTTDVLNGQLGGLSS